MSRLTVSAALTGLVLAGCQNQTPTEPASVETDYSTEVDINGEKRVMPISQLKLDDGAIASFYVWEDLSAGYVVMGPDGAQQPTTELDGLSAAEAFYAMSRGDLEMPAALLEHHQALAEDATRPVWQQAIAEHARGWYLDMPKTLSLNECNNGSFVANYCNTSGFAGTHCFTDTNGNYSTVAFGSGTGGGTRKFSAAFCIDAGGKTEDLLQYYGWCGGGSASIWVGTHYSPSWAAFTWIAPSGALPRDWRHTGYSYGHSRDWASRWGSWASCGS